MILPPSFFALENELIALGRKQRILQRESERLGFYCRARELEGASPQRAQADYRRFQHKLVAAIDVYGLRTWTR